MDELRAKRAANFEARNVQNCMKLCYVQIKQYWARNVHILKLGMYKTVWYYDMHTFRATHTQYWAINVQTVDELRAKRAAHFEARNVQNCMKLWYARFACKQVKQYWARNVPTVQYMDELRSKERTTVWNYDIHAKRDAKFPMLIINVSNDVQYVMLEMDVNWSSTLCVTSTWPFSIEHICILTIWEG